MCDAIMNSGYFGKGTALANRFNDIPDVMMNDLVSRMGPAELVKFCSTNKSSNSICKNDLLWKDLFQKDFGNIKYVKEHGMTWANLYKEYTKKYKYEIVSYNNGTLYLYKNGANIANPNNVRNITRVKVDGILAPDQFIYVEAERIFDPITMRDALSDIPDVVHTIPDTEGNQREIKSLKRRYPKINFGIGLF